MQEKNILRTDQPKGSLDRRSFLKSGFAAGMGLLLTRPSNLSAVGRSGGQLNVAIIGLGAQGRVLIESCLKIPDIRFQAVCDI